MKAIMDENMNDNNKNDERNVLLYMLEQYCRRPITYDDVGFVCFANEKAGWSFDMLIQVLDSGVGATGSFSIELYKEKVKAMIKCNVKDMDSFNDFKKKNATFDDLVERILMVTRKKLLVERELVTIVNWQRKWDDDVILAAFEYASNIGVTDIVMYVRSILATWEVKGIKTIDDVILELGTRSSHREKTLAQNKKVFIEYPKNPLYHNFNSEGLLACPFCGGEDIILQSQYSQKADGYYCMVVCNVCGSRTRSIKNDIEVSPNSPYFWKSVVIDEVKAMWNTRA